MDSPLAPDAISSLQLRTGSNSSHPEVESISSLHLFSPYFKHLYTQLMYTAQVKALSVQIEILNSNEFQEFFFRCERTLLVTTYAKPPTALYHLSNCLEKLYHIKSVQN